MVPFVVFLIAMTAELKRPPFDLVEAEQEIVGGFHTEYSSIRFALFFLAEFMNVISMSALLVTLFLGGPQPLLIGSFDLFAVLGPFGGTAWLLLKVFLFLYVYVWFRATLPRLRYDQLMDLGWKVLIPVALGWFLLLAALQLGRDNDLSQVGYVTLVIVCLSCSDSATCSSPRRSRSPGGIAIGKGRRTNGIPRRIRGHPPPASPVRR